MTQFFLYNNHAVIILPYHMMPLHNAYNFFFSIDDFDAFFEGITNEEMKYLIVIVCSILQVIVFVVFGRFLWIYHKRYLADDGLVRGMEEGEGEDGSGEMSVSVTTSPRSISKAANIQINPLQDYAGRNDQTSSSSTGKKAEMR